MVKRRFTSVPGTDPEPAYAPELKVALETIVDEMQIPCAVVMIRSEPKGDWSATCGTRRLGTDDPVTIDDHFRVGSNTKTMTGTVVLQLAEEDSDFGLDDPVSKYRPEVPNGDNITLAMLLEMRSGLYNYSADEGFNARLDDEPGHAWHPSELLAIAFAHRPSFDPAADFEYSNTNTVLLGLIIEQRTRLSLQDAFQQRIFDRLQLHHTRFPAADDVGIPSPHPRGYMFGTNVSTLVEAALPASEQAAAAKGTLLPNDHTDSNPSWTWAAGGAISTADDLARYVEALVDGGLLGPRLQEIRLASIRPAGSDPASAGYGYGIAQFGPMIGHDGQLPGFNSFMARDPDARNTVIVLTSLFAGANGLQPANELARAIITALYH
jgi:D-alanyl-D-alanine carboxypeptidase